jgi:hypothetical protein
MAGPSFFFLLLTASKVMGVVGVTSVAVNLLIAHHLYNTATISTKKQKRKDKPSSPSSTSEDSTTEKPAQQVLASFPIHKHGKLPHILFCFCH